MASNNNGYQNASACITSKPVSLILGIVRGDIRGSSLFTGDEVIELLQQGLREAQPPEIHIIIPSFEFDKLLECPVQCTCSHCTDQPLWDMLARAEIGACVDPRADDDPILHRMKRPDRNSILELEVTAGWPSDGDGEHIYTVVDRLLKSHARMPSSKHQPFFRGSQHAL